MLYLHLKHVENGAEAVLIAEKKPFDLDQDILAQLLDKSETKLIVKNDVYINLDLFLPSHLNAVKSTLIYPANEKLIDKYRMQKRFLVNETPIDYQTITLPYIIEHQHSLQWVENVLEHRNEAERIIFEDVDETNGFLMAPDLKWDGINVENLYVQAIVKRRGIKSVRDLTSNDLPLLLNIRKKGLIAIEQRYGIRQDQVKMFFHYQPSFYHLHVHFISLSFNAPASGIASAILLDDVINNLSIASDFYQRSTLTFLRKDDDPLLKLFRQAGRSLP